MPWGSQKNCFVFVCKVVETKLLYGNLLRKFIIITYFDLNIFHDVGTLIHIYDFVCYKY